MALQVAQDLKDEAAELHGFLSTLTSEDWEQTTLFMNWTPWDIVAHLHFFDRMSLRSLEGEESFAVSRAELMKEIQAGRRTDAIARKVLGDLDAQALLAAWKEGCFDLADGLAQRNPKDRLPWYGPDMGVPMFTTARYMETWSHAQAIYDLKKAPRVHTDRIRNIVAIGVKTFGWTFVNRKQEIPGPPPFVQLTSPSGEVWEYNEPSETEKVSGSALDFCLTVAQVRNFQDTELEVVGDVAHAWMEIAQCFAGGPVDPPKPGVRPGVRPAVRPGA